MGNARDDQGGVVRKRDLPGFNGFRHDPATGNYSTVSGECSFPYLIQYLHVVYENYDCLQALRPVSAPSSAIPLGDPIFQREGERTLEA